jgi:hypothetical protein
MNAELAQMVPVSGWIGRRTLGIDGFWQPLAAFGRLSGVCRRMPTFFLVSAPVFCLGSPSVRRQLAMDSSKS